MTNDHVDALLRFLSDSPSRRGALRLLGGSAVGSLLALATMTADAKKGGKGKKKKKKDKGKKVTICHNGQTLSVGSPALKGHLGHGDTVGACPPPSPPPPPAPIFRFKADPMTGANEVPSGSGDSNGSGSARFAIQGATICGVFQFATTPNSQVSGAHIHAGDSTIDGPIVVDFGAPPLGQQFCIPCPPTACQDIQSNPAAFYANTHTEAFPDGAVRAQLQVDNS